MTTRVLVVRNDKLGDFMLAWPTFALIKHHWPEATLIALVPDYTAALARLCPWIDEVVIDEGEGPVPLARKLAAAKIDMMVALFSTSRVAIAGWLARIPYRLAPATKAFQLFYNRRVVQRRSRSQKPEYAYNLDLGYRLLQEMHGAAETRTTERNGDFLPGEIPRPLLASAAHTLPDRARFCAAQRLRPELPLVFIHPGSGGSANNLSPSQYAALANRLHRQTPLNFVVTAGPREAAIARQLAGALEAPCCVLETAGIEALVAHLTLADLFISGSTGPMHIAAALDRPTATFFPRHRSATPLRWQPLNHPAKRLALTPPASAAADEVSAIDIAQAAEQIARRFFSSRRSR